MSEIELRDLQAFAAVARHRNFRRAARELRVSVSSLSQRLRDLEVRLGIRLLNRTTRSVAPTEAGETLLLRLTPALREVAEAVSDLRSRHELPAGRLRINAPPPAIHLVLAPMLGPFLRRHPGIELELVADALLIDIVAEGFDAGVRYEEHLDQDMIAVPLGPPQRYAVVAAPALLSHHGRPEQPADLLGKPCIVTRFRNGVVLPWEFEKAGRTVRITPSGVLQTSDHELKLRAALDGLGFLLTFEGYLREAVAAGRLVALLEDWCPPFPGPFLYYPSRHRPPPALAAFVAFVKEWRRTGTAG